MTAGYEQLAESLLEILQQPCVPHLSKGIWLTGPAGVGKSFLVATVIHTWRNNQTLPEKQHTHNNNNNNETKPPLTNKHHCHYDLYWFSVWDLWARLEAEATASVEEIVQWLWEELDMPHQHMILHHQNTLSPHTFTPSENRSSLDTNILAKDDRIAVVLDDVHSIMDILNDDENRQHHQRSSAERLQAALVDFCRQILSCPQVAVIGITRSSTAQQDQQQSSTKQLTSTNLLDIHFHMDAPSNRQRARLLQEMFGTKGFNIQLSDAVLWANALADRTAGCVASDLVQLCRRAQLMAMSSSSIRSKTTNHDDNDDDGSDNSDTMTHHWNIPLQDIGTLDNATNSTPILWEHVVEAARTLVPSQLEHLDVIHPPVLEKNALAISWYERHQLAWKPFAGYATLIHRLYRTIVLPHLSISQMGTTKTNDDTKSNPTPLSSTTTTNFDTTLIDPPRGVIFHGPSGCGKSLAATCLGAALGWPMIRVAPVHVLDKYLGGSEALLRQYFAKARQAAPCILLLEEIDAIATNRNNSEEEEGVTGGVMSRLLSTLLNEMDGIASSPPSSSSSSSSNRVLVVACTNRMDRLDAALLRPGRLEEHVEIPLPTVDDAIALLRHYWYSPTRGGMVTDDEVDFETLAKHLVNDCHGTAATMEGVAREAVLQCIRRRSGAARPPEEVSGETLFVSQQDIDQALKALFLE